MRSRHPHDRRRVGGLDRHRHHPAGPARPGAAGGLFLGDIAASGEETALSLRYETDAGRVDPTLGIAKTLLS